MIYNTPIVSILLSAYNAEKYIEGAIRCVLDQSFRNFEFIVINDGSTDNTLKIIEKFNDDRIVIINQENKGLTKSLNIGLSIAKGKYIARLDADDICTSDRLLEQVSYMESHLSVALLGSYHCRFDVSNSKIEYITPPISNKKLKLFLALRGTPFNHSSVIFRKNIVLNLNGYNEKFRHSQDYDLWVRIAKMNKIAVQPKFLCLSRRNLTGSVTLTRNKWEAFKVGQKIKYGAFRQFNIPLWYFPLFIFFSFTALLPKFFVRNHIFKDLRDKINSLSIRPKKNLSTNQMLRIDEIINKYMIDEN